MAIVFGTFSYLLWKSIRPDFINCPQCGITVATCNYVLRCGHILFIPLLPLDFLKIYTCESCGSLLSKGG